MDAQIKIEKLKELLEENGEIELNLDDYIVHQITIQNSKSDKVMLFNNRDEKYTIMQSNKNNGKFIVGKYYNVKEVAKLLWELLNSSKNKNISQNFSTLNRTNRISHKLIIISSAEDLYKEINRKFSSKSASILSEGRLESKEKYISSEELVKVINSLMANPDLLTNNFYTDIKLEEKTNQKTNQKYASVKVTRKIINKNENENRHSEEPKQTGYQQEQQAHQRNNYQSDSYSEVTPTTTSYEEPLREYVNKNDEKEQIINPKRKKIEILNKKNLSRLLAAINAILIVSTAIYTIKGLKGEDNPIVPEPPTPTPVSSSVVENPNGEDEIRIEITAEDLYKNIDLGASYFISGTDVYTSSTDIERAGTTTDSYAIVTQFAICEKQKDTNGNTVLTPLLTIGLDDGEMNLEEFINKVLSENPKLTKSDIVLKAHVIGDGAYGWIDVNTSTFANLYNDLKKTSKITYKVI